MKPLILVINDDSYKANGIYELIDRMLPFGDVIAVCPENPQSGKSMAITVNDPLFVKELPEHNGAKIYTVSGTPVDCVKLAMHHILPRRPDLLVSGINHGSNTAVNVLYSGTMGAAMEGCAFGLPSIGFSLCDHSLKADFAPCYRVIDMLTEAVMKNGLPEGVCLNVNVPKVSETPGEARLCVPCRGRWNDEYQRYTDPHGRPYFWLTGEYENEEPDNTQTDEWCVHHGIISVVPVAVERTIGVDTTVSWLPGFIERYNSGE